MNYKLTINANISFEYYPYEKTTSEEVPYIVNRNEIEYYDEYHDVELEITPKMLLECLDFVYKYDKGERDSQMRRYELLVALENNNWYFNKLCAEIFNEENLDEYTSIYRSSCPSIKDLLYWIPKDVQERLKAKGYKLVEYETNDYFEREHKEICFNKTNYVYRKVLSAL